MITTRPLHPSLPPKPSLSLSTPARQNNHQPPTSTQVSNTTSLCAVCNLQTSKYTCPGCSTRTCSLPCSSSHKSSTGCTGQRNKASYVPMNKYSWGTMVDDYVFLEDVGRRVNGWGREIVQDGLRNSNNTGLKGMVDNRDGISRGRGGHSKRDILKIQLEAKDIEIDLLPLGMDRRRLNQSAWDFKKQSAFLTIQLVFNKPKDPLAPSSRPPDPPYTLCTHKNDINKSLISLIRSRLQGARSKKNEAYPTWIKQLVFPDDEDPEAFINPQCVMAARLDPIVSKRLHIPSRNAYYSLDCTQPLEIALRHTQFVEFPTIEVWEEFEGTIVDIQGVVQQEEQRPTKRVKLNLKAGKKAIQGLLGEYGSSEEDERQQEKEQSQNVLATLDQYTGSEDEEMELQEDNGTGTDGDHDAEIGADIDRGVLLELLRSVRERDKTWYIEDEDAVDWGDDDVDGDDRQCINFRHPVDAGPASPSSVPGLLTRHQ